MVGRENIKGYQCSMHNAMVLHLLLRVHQRFLKVRSDTWELQMVLPI